MDSSVASKLKQVKVLVDECLRSLDNQENHQTEAIPTETPNSVAQEIDFTRPIRPYMKTFVDLSGSRKFVLLLAWLAKGDPEKQIPLADVQSQWDNMSGMLKIKFNRKFSSEAREADWVDTRKSGLYNLRPNWTKVLTRSGG
jgi:hypothetical protein